MYICTVKHAVFHCLGKFQMQLCSGFLICHKIHIGIFLPEVFCLLRQDNLCKCSRLYLHFCPGILLIDRCTDKFSIGICLIIIFDQLPVICPVSLDPGCLKFCKKNFLIICDRHSIFVCHHLDVFLLDLLLCLPVNQIKIYRRICHCAKHHKLIWDIGACVECCPGQKSKDTHIPNGLSSLKFHHTVGNQVMIIFLRMLPPLVIDDKKHKQHIDSDCRYEIDCIPDSRHLKFQ